MAQNPPTPPPPPSGTPPPGTIDLRALPAGGTAGTTSGTAPVPPAAGKFNIPDDVKQKYPDLISLILETESMNDEERDYWFQILPIMTPEQVDKFRTILINEKEQLTKLDSEYQQEISKLNEKHLLEWQEFERKEKWKQIGEAEAKAETEEKAFEEELLKKLSDV